MIPFGYLETLLVESDLSTVNGLINDESYRQGDAFVRPTLPGNDAVQQELTSRR
jgi:hypothetical protein